MTSLHKEISFEDEICEHLGANGWLYEAGDGVLYDRPRALFPPDLIAWVEATHKLEAWETLTKNHGATAEVVLLDRLRKQMDDRGTLDVIRHGVELIGLRRPLALAQFKPAMGMNPDIVARYAANRLRVIRQVRYSTHNEYCLDLVLFLNGLPIATVELKTDFTQSVGDAVDQYRFDRHPRPKGRPPEPLLSFPAGALVHFAVSNSEVMMTTQLEGPQTRFLPFNLGDHGGQGNPVSPHGHRTSYLWEQVWQRDSWLEILGRYLVTQRNDKKQITGVIFPRYHQLDATRKLQAAVLAEGAGSKYLIQHSAGSGKTNSIAWSAHFLSDLHGADDDKLFSTVIVVSDRRVIDGQLQDALFDFQRTTGVVATIKNEGGAKSANLAKALSEGKRIIVCTIQTFPFALEAVRELAATEGKRFAVIADEAHSSQTGEAAAKLKLVLSPEEIRALEDGGEVSTEDLLAAQMAARASDVGVTYVAFTATPKAKTLQLFGRPPKPDQPLGDDNLPAPFHVYSMRQAIEEGFILDVLKNYTPYRLAFRLANNGKEWDDKEVERDAALKGIMRWVRLHPYNISQKVQIVVEHYRENVAPLLDGKAKAMVVLASRRGRPVATSHRQIHQGPRLRVRDPGRFLRRSERQRLRPRSVRRDQQGTEPEPEGPRHPRGVQGRRVSDPAGGEQIPDRVRPAAALRHVCGPPACRHSGRADTLAAQPGLSRQGHHLRAGLRQQLRGGAGGVQDLLRDGRAGGRHRPEPDLRSARQARRRRLLRRLRGRPCRGR